MLTRMHIGRVVKVTAGRERGRYCVIIGAESEQYVYVADGRKRTVAHPKRKNIRHLQAVSPQGGVMTGTREWRDEEIRAAIADAQAKGGSDEQGRRH